MKKILTTITAAMCLTTPAWSAWIHDWSRAMGSTGTEEGACIALDQNNYSVSAGYFTGSVDFDPGSGTTVLSTVGGTGTDMYMIRKSNVGTLVWAKQVGGTGTAFPLSIIIDNGGGDIFVCGRFYGQIDFNLGASPSAIKTSAGQDDIFIARYDVLTGALVWLNTFGSTGQDGGQDVHFDGAGNVLMTGYFQGTVNFATGSGKNNLVSNSGSVDVFYARYAMSNGTAGWTKGFGGSGIDVGNGISCDGSTYIFLCGHFQSSSMDVDPGTGTYNLTLTGSQDAFFGRYALSSGNFSTWSYSFGATNLDNKATDLAYNNDATTPQVTITGFANGAITFPSGGPGYTSSGRDAYVISYSPAGSYIWGNGFSGSSGNEEGTDIARSGDYVYICGYFENTVDFDISGSSVTATSAGLTDIFMLRYKEDGVFKDVSGMGSTGVDVANGICAFNAPDIAYITGSFNGTVDFDPGAGTVNRTSAGGADIFHNRYSWTTPTRIAGPSVYNVSSPFPNPASDRLFINDVKEGSVVQIYGMNGQLCASQTVCYDGQVEIGVSNLENGVYLLLIKANGESTRSERIVIQHQ